MCYVGALGSRPFNNVSFLSYFLTLTPSVNGLVERPATLVRELGCHVGINFKQVELELYMHACMAIHARAHAHTHTHTYRYIYIHIYIQSLL